MISCCTIPKEEEPIDYKEAYEAATRSKLAYKEPIEILSMIKHNLELYEQYISPQPKFITSPVESDQDAQAYIWKKDNTIYLSFRGTSSKKDIIADADIRTHKIKDKIYVHRGFFLQFNSIESLITQEIHDDAEYLYVSGHSLGGGLAQIAAAFYAELFPNIKVICHTFGAPRTGNKYFVEWFNKNVHKNYRFVNTQDPVPMIPQRPIWTHTCQRCIQIDDTYKVKILKKDTKWYSRLFKTLITIDFFNPIHDHDCDIYLDRIKKMI